MGRSGKGYVIENRSWESIAKGVFEMCQEVIQCGYASLLTPEAFTPKNG